MILKLNGKRITVISIAEAQLKVHEESTRVGSSEFYARNPVNGCAVHSGDMLLGRISYNAKFWPAPDSNPTSTHDLPPTEGGVMNAKIKKSTTKIPTAMKPVKKNPAAEAFWNKPATPSQDEAPVTEAPVADAEVPAVEQTEPVVVTTATVKASRKAARKAAKEGEQKPTPPPAEDGLVVFALRMTLDERTRLHETAGPAKASRFARMILNAAANRDIDKLREIVEATKSAQ